MESSAVVARAVGGSKLLRRWPRENGFGLVAASDIAIGQSRLVYAFAHTDRAELCVFRVSGLIWIVVYMYNGQLSSIFLFFFQ